MNIAPYNQPSLPRPQGGAAAVPGKLESPSVQPAKSLESVSPSLSASGVKSAFVSEPNRVNTASVVQPSVTVQLSPQSLAQQSSPQSSQPQSLSPNSLSPQPTAPQSPAPQSPSPQSSPQSAGVAPSRGPTTDAGAQSKQARPTPVSSGAGAARRPSADAVSVTDDGAKGEAVNGSAQGATAVPVERRGGEKPVDEAAAQEKAQAEAEQKEVQALKARDLEVRRHEQAHANAGGIHAGAPTYEFQTGPDGARYAVGGEVSIDTSPVPGDPQATLDKAQAVRRAALAPAEPSEQDRRVAAEASQMAAQARVELMQLRRSEEASGSERDAEAIDKEDAGKQALSESEGLASTGADGSNAEADNDQESAERPALLYSDEAGDKADQSGSQQEDAEDSKADEPSARERFEQVYGDVSSLTQQVSDIAQWEAAQPAMENLLDDIV